MSTTGGNVGIKRAWPPGFNGWAGDSDMNLLLLDALTQPIVKSVTISAPPGLPAQGDTYIVGGAPTGAWSGKANNIAIWDGVAWQFVVAKNGWGVYCQSDSGTYRFDGTNWTPSYLAGTWAPTAAALENCSSVVVTSANYTRVGKLIHVVIVGTLTITTAGSELEFSITPPVATTGSATGSAILTTTGAVGTTFALSGGNITALFLAGSLLTAGSKTWIASLTYIV